MDGGYPSFSLTRGRALLKSNQLYPRPSSSRTFGRMSVTIEDAGFITHPMIGWISAAAFRRRTASRRRAYRGFRYGGAGDQART